MKEQVYRERSWNAEKVGLQKRRWIAEKGEGLQRKEYDYEGKDCREMNKIMKGRVAEKGIRLWRESL